MPHVPFSQASPGAAIFGQDTLLDITFLAEWNKIGENRQHQTDLNTQQENRSCHDWNYKVCYQVLLRKDGILHKSASWHASNPWTITFIHTNETNRVQCGMKSEQFNIRRVTPFDNQTLQCYKCFYVLSPSPIQTLMLK
jgi:hypothetical protein